MLLYTRKAPAKPPKRRSRAGCVHCKEKKKKCNEERPACDRCTERGLKCEYEPIKPRKRRRTISPSEINGQALHLLPPQTAVNNGFHSRLQALRRDPVAGMAAISTSAAPRLAAIAEGWEIRSAFEEPPHYGEFFSEPTMSPFQTIDPFAPGQEFHSSPVESIDMMLNDIHGHSPHPMPSPHHIQSPHHIAPTTPELITSIPHPAASVSPYQRSPSVFSTAPPMSAPLSSTPVSPSANLIDHFCRELAPLLVFKEQNNPYLDLILPLSHHSSVLQSALFSVSSAHRENLGLPVEQKSLDLHSKALQGLLGTLGRKEAEDEDSTLAAMLLLLHYEVIHNSSAVALRSHLSGALSMMQGRIAARSPTTVFLERAFRYFDVLLALSSGRAPLGGSILPSWDHELPQIMEPSIMASVDPMFGLMTDLWPILHRLGELVEIKRQTADGTHRRDSLHLMQTDLDTSAANIELFLHQWKPSLPATSPIEGGSRTDSRLQSITSHAEAYKQAALIHLHREVYGAPRTSPKIQGPLKQVFQACLRVMMFSGPIKGLLWPLFTAAVETVEQVDINVARTCFDQLEKKQGMSSIMVGWEVCEEVWTRRAAGQDPADWRQVAAEIDREIIFG